MKRSFFRTIICCLTILTMTTIRARIRKPPSIKMAAVPSL